MYTLVNGIVERLNRRSRVLVHTPWVRTLGDGSETIYFSLLKARREGKQVFFLFRRPLWSKLRIQSCNTELFRVGSPYRRQSPWLQWLGDWLVTLFFACLGIACLAVRRVRRCLAVFAPRLAPGPLDLRYLVPSFGFPSLWCPGGTATFSWDVVAGMEWQKQFLEPLPVFLSEDKRRRAERQREDMGLPLSNWFVCLHVREGGYWRDRQRAGVRNATISHFVDALRLITDAGGWVVRLGDPSMTPLPSLPHVIDYPFTRFKGELMDVYLMSECRFALCTNSGPSDLARLFQKPMILANLTEWTYTFPGRRGELAILRHVYSRTRERFLSLAELIEEPWHCQAFHESPSEYVMVENSAAEIRALAAEYLNAEERVRYSPLQEAFSEGRRAQIRRWVDDGAPSWSRSENRVAEQYRIAARLGAAGALSRSYVENNWHGDSLNADPGALATARRLAEGAGVPGHAASRTDRNAPQLKPR